MIDMSTPDRWITVTAANNPARRAAQLRQCQFAATSQEDQERRGCPCPSAYCCPFRSEIQRRRLPGDASLLQREANIRTVDDGSITEGGACET